MKLYAHILFTIFAFFYTKSIIAQDIYGLGNAFGVVDRGVVKFSMHTKKDTLISTQVNHINKYGYNTTSDLQSLLFYVTADDTSTLDTIISFDVLTKAVAKYPIEKNMMKHPELHQNVIYGVCPYGYSCFDLNTKTLRICDTIINDFTPGNEFDKYIIDKSFDHNLEYYIYLKRGLAISGQSDTLFRYHIRTKTLQNYPVPFTISFEYSPISDKAYCAGAHYDRVTPTKVLFSYDFNTNQTSILRYFASVAPHNFTIDPFKNRLYFRTYYAIPHTDSMMQYRINNNIMDYVPVSSTWKLGYMEFLPTYNDTTTDPKVDLPSTEINKLLVYPTIVRDDVYIRNIEPASAVILSNTIGQTVKHEKVYTTDYKYNMTGLSAGLYILNITSPEGHNTIYKLVKQ